MFSCLIFDVFPCEALPAAETLKIREIRDSDNFLHNRNLTQRNKNTP